MGKEIKQIEIDKITHIKCDTYLSTIFYEGGTHDTCVKNLKTFENELLEFDFIRVNHNSIINLKYLDYIKKGSKK